jgi:putative membrane protein
MLLPDDSTGGPLASVEMLSQIDLQLHEVKHWVGEGSTVTKKVAAILTILSFLSLTPAVFAQSSLPGDQGPRPGPGYGVAPGGEYGYGPGYANQIGPDSSGGYGRGPGMTGPGWGGGYGMGPGMMGPGMFVFMLIFLVFVIAGIVLLMRYLSPHARSKPANDAMEVLRRRYARGEIQKAEFEEKRKDLES